MQFIWCVSCYYLKMYPQETNACSECTDANLYQESTGYDAKVRIKAMLLKIELDMMFGDLLSNEEYWYRIGLEKGFQFKYNELVGRREYL